MFFNLSIIQCLCSFGPIGFSLKRTNQRLLRCHIHQSYGRFRANTGPSITINDRAVWHLKPSGVWDWDSTYTARYWFLCAKCHEVIDGHEMLHKQRRFRHFTNQQRWDSNATLLSLQNSIITDCHIFQLKIYSFAPP